MKLQVFNKTTTPSSRSNSVAKITISKSGPISFNERSMELLEIPPPSKTGFTGIEIAFDEEEQEWYVYASKEDSAFSLRQTSAKKTWTFNSSVLACKILEAAGVNIHDSDAPKTTSFSLAPEAVIANKRKYFAILFSSANSMTRKPKKK